MLENSEDSLTDSYLRNNFTYFGIRRHTAGTFSVFCA